MKKYFFIMACLLAILFINSKAIASGIDDNCSNSCICGYDNDGDGSLSESEFNELNHGATGTPTFSELDVNEDRFIDSNEITKYPGCES